MHLQNSPIGLSEVCVKFAKKTFADSIFTTNKTGVSACEQSSPYLH